MHRRGMSPRSAKTPADSRLRADGLDAAMDAAYARVAATIANRFPVASPEDAQDVTQEAFVRFILKFRQAGDGDRRLSSTAEVVRAVLDEAQAIVRNTYRKRVRRERLAARIPPVPPASQRVDPVFRHAHAAAAAADASRLPHKLRRVLLGLANGLSYREIAEKEGIPEGTVKSRVHRARAALAQSGEGRR